MLSRLLLNFIYLFIYKYIIVMKRNRMWFEVWKMSRIYWVERGEWWKMRCSRRNHRKTQERVSQGSELVGDKAGVWPWRILRVMLSRLRILTNQARVLSRDEMIIFVFLKDPHDSIVKNKSEGDKSKWKWESIRE